MAKFLGVDTGGTFTDFIVYDDESSAVRIHKVLSTPASPEKAILQGITELGLEKQMFSMVHGSTVATNAILENKGVRTAYVTNNGLADVLTIGRQARAELYNLSPIKKPPLIAPELCIEVDSRLSATGEHLRQLGDDNLETLIAQLEQLAPKAIAINLLFSFFDDSEELKIEQAIKDNARLKRVFISRSSDVLPEYKEYERGMATVLNAKVGPLMQGYLTRLQAALSAIPLSIMQSSGGTSNSEYAGRYPVNLLLSGPAGGLKGAQTVAGASAIDKILSFDMGGTSTDVSIIDKDIGFTTEAKISSYPVAVPMVDMQTIGAGGGSIAQVDAGGLLLVGPESAGASPGPACYGKGGRRATVTDANVVLGRLLPESFLGGNMQLDRAASIEVVQAIASALSANGKTVSSEQAAQGIIDVVNDHMVRALRVMSVERGEDPKDFTLVSFGGAGGLHVCALAEELEMRRALVPVNAGVLSALGMLAADASRERSRTINKIISDCDAQDIEKISAELISHARADLGETEAKLIINRTLDVRYQGQSDTLSLPWEHVQSENLQAIEQAFHQKHDDSYGHRLDIEVELVNVRVRVIEQKRSFRLPEWRAEQSSEQSVTKMTGFDQPVAVIHRNALNAGERVTGPALIIEASSTTWLAREWTADVDAVGNLILLKK